MKTCSTRFGARQILTISSTVTMSMLARRSTTNSLSLRSHKNRGQLYRKARKDTSLAASKRPSTTVESSRAVTRSKKKPVRTDLRMTRGASRWITNHLPLVESKTTLIGRVGSKTIIFREARAPHLSLSRLMGAVHTSRARKVLCQRLH